MSPSRRIIGQVSVVGVRPMVSQWQNPLAMSASVMISIHSTTLYTPVVNALLAWCEVHINTC